MVSGYTIPKGWKVLVWFRTCHLDPETWPEPMKFNPSRWDVSPINLTSRYCNKKPIDQH